MRTIRLVKYVTPLDVILILEYVPDGGSVKLVVHILYHHLLANPWVKDALTGGMVHLGAGLLPGCIKYNLAPFCSEILVHGRVAIDGVWFPGLNEFMGHGPSHVYTTYVMSRTCCLLAASARGLVDNGTAHGGCDLGWTEAWGCLAHIFKEFIYTITGQCSLN
jgi:hypothetical protein